MKARQERELLRLYDAARTLGRELLIEIIASKNGADRRRHGRARDRAALCHRRQAGLVEARRPGERRRPGTTSARDRRGARSVVPRRHAARARGAGGGSWRRRSASRAAAAWSTASRSAARSSSSRRSNWFAGRIGDAEAVERHGRSASRGCARCGGSARSAMIARSSIRAGAGLRPARALAA